jgi:hypothetical protein
MKINHIVLCANIIVWTGLRSELKFDMLIHTCTKIDTHDNVQLCFILWNNNEIPY